MEKLKCKVLVHGLHVLTFVMGNRDLSERLLVFAISVGEVVDRLPRSTFGRQIAWQLSDSGTSPMANYEEACAAESRRDFVHKMSICLKELRESKSWLRLIKASELLSAIEVEPHIDECDQLCRIFAKSIITAKSKM